MLKMPTVGILTFMSTVNFILMQVEHEKFYNLQARSQFSHLNLHFLTIFLGYIYPNDERNCIRINSISSPSYISAHSYSVNHVDFESR